MSLLTSMDRVKMSLQKEGPRLQRSNEMVSITSRFANTDRSPPSRVCLEVQAPARGKGREGGCPKVHFRIVLNLADVRELVGHRLSVISRWFRLNLSVFLIDAVG